MYNGEALGKRKSVRKRRKDRAAVFTAPTTPSAGRGRGVARFAAIVVALAALGASIPEAYSGLQGSDMFTLQKISVVGSDLITPEEVVRRSGLTQGINLFETNLETATDSIVAHPLVRNALLLRRPPDSLVISVEERASIALVSTDRGLRGFDCDAVTFNLPNRPFDLPIVTGLEAVLADSSVSEFAVGHSVARFIETASRDQAEFWSHVSEVCLVSPSEGDLILADGMTLKVKLDGITQQIQNYKAFVASGNVPGEGLAYVDLRYENQVVAGRLDRDPTSIESLMESIGISD